MANVDGDNVEETKGEERKIIFKEFRMETEYEQEEITKFLIKETKRINERVPTKKGTKPSGESDDSEDGDDQDDTIENAFMSIQANSKED